MSSEIADLIDRRRAALSTPALQTEASLHCVEGAWGLALSGGGIRSATFCFGLLQALACKRLLLRFDLLSTVSGGGYIGAMFSRLIQRAESPQDLMAILDALRRGGDSWFAWWLRANGRYLVPQGVKDRVFALAIYMRNLVGIHLELGLLGLLVGALLCTSDTVVWKVLAWWTQDHWGAVDWVREWLFLIPTLWIALPFVAFGLFALCWAFWMISWIHATFWKPLILAILCLVLLGLLFVNRRSFANDAFTLNPLALWIVIVLVLAWLFALLFAKRAWAVSDAKFQALPLERREGDGVDAGRAEAGPNDVYDAARNYLTKSLAGTLGVFVGFLLFGAIDRAAWWLTFEHKSFVGAGYGLVVAAAFLRTLLSPTSAIRQAATRFASLAVALSVAGRVVTVALLVWWVAVMQRLALSQLFRQSTNDVTLHTTSRVDFDAPVAWLLALLIPVLCYLFGTGRNVAFLNLSSLHGFYRARLIRSYLGATNGWRFSSSGDFMPLDRFRGADEPAALPESLASTYLRAAGRLPRSPEDESISHVADVDSSDDIALHQYAPHERGGPIHLLNVCLNETEDPRGKLFNRDRKGRALTIGPRGMIRVGLRKWDSIKDRAGALTLGSWMAISGAAVSPGLGSQTRGGISSLAMFAGVRLGYWWDSRAIRGSSSEPRPRSAKIKGLLSETRGVFAGPEERDWFLTDGGHFENTGAYALLVERAKVIVVVDCSADPTYQFNDLENLVRKARIDLQAEIHFLKPRTLDAATEAVQRSSVRALWRTFGSLNDLSSNTSDACFALARIAYASPDDDRPAGRYEVVGGECGYLILVKPNLCSGLPVDLVNFRRDHPQFPQQSTADQFFDEAQWESYFALGKALGERLALDSITALLSEVGTLFVDDDGSPIKNREDGKLPNGSTGPPWSRLPARIASSAVSTTIGVGVIAAAATAAWQAIDSLRSGAAQQLKDERAAAKELADAWSAHGRLQTDELRVGAIGNTATLLSRLADTLCPGDDAGWFNRSPLAVDILKDTIEQCRGLSDAIRPHACQRLIEISDPHADGSRASCLRAGWTTLQEETKSRNCAIYWAYDYRRHPVLSCANPADPEVKPLLVLDRLGTVVPAPDRHAVASPPLSLVDTSGTPACSGKVIAPRTYGTSSREAIEGYVARWNAAGMDVDATLDLVRLARERSLVEPAAVERLTVRYYDSSSKRCADFVARMTYRWPANVEASYSSLPERRNLLEVMIPPTRQVPVETGECGKPAAGRTDAGRRDASCDVVRKAGGDNGDGGKVRCTTRIPTSSGEERCAPEVAARSSEDCVNVTINTIVEGTPASVARPRLPSRPPRPSRHPVIHPRLCTATPAPVEH